VAEVIQDGQRLQPCAACLRRVTGILMGVTEVSERVGLMVTAAQLTGEVNGTVVAGDGVWVSAEVAVDEAEAVPGGGLAEQVAELVAEAHGLRAASERELVITKLCAIPADAVQRSSLSGLVAGGLQQFERLLSVAERPLGMARRVAAPAEPIDHAGEVEVYPGLPDTVAELGVKPEGAAQVRTGVVV
jgi:hypothetical protein